MRYQLLMGVCVLAISLVFGVLWNAQSTQAIQTFTPTPINSDDLRVFPGDLVCAERNGATSSIGPMWLGITIGQSTLEDVEQLLSTLDYDYVFIGNDDYNTRFLNSEFIQHEPGIPSAIRLCLVKNEVQVLAVSFNVDLSVPRPVLSDLVAQFGEPDTVTWTENPATRVVFWFEQGMAFEVAVLPNKPSYQPTFGRVVTEIYFPYQEIDGYESRWPYNQTRKFNEYLRSPEDPSTGFGVENPFDFSAMITTSTPEPSCTFTPTLVSPPSTPTPTRTR